MKIKNGTAVVLWLGYSLVELSD